MSFDDWAKTEVTRLEIEKEELIKKISELELENQRLEKRLEFVSLDRDYWHAYANSE